MCFLPVLLRQWPRFVVLSTITARNLKWICCDIGSSTKKSHNASLDSIRCAMQQDNQSWQSLQSKNRKGTTRRHRIHKLETQPPRQYTTDETKESCWGHNAVKLVNKHKQFLTTGGLLYTQHILQDKWHNIWAWNYNHFLFFFFFYKWTVAAHTWSQW